MGQQSCIPSGIRLAGSRDPMCGFRQRAYVPHTCACSVRVQRARAHAMGGVGGPAGRGRRRRGGWPGLKATAVPWSAVPSSAVRVSAVPVSVVPSSAVPVSAVPASTMRMRAAAATSPAARGTQHLPSEERNGRGRHVRVTRAGQRVARTHLSVAGRVAVMTTIWRRRCGRRRLSLPCEAQARGQQLSGR